MFPYASLTEVGLKVKSPDPRTAGCIAAASNVNNLKRKDHSSWYKLLENHRLRTRNVGAEFFFAVASLAPGSSNQDTSE